MTTEDIENYNKMVDNSSDRLRDLCDQWTNEITENEKNINEDVIQKIHSVIGKSQLLRNSKLKQFRAFLSDAERNIIGKPVKLDDIRGFWETIYIQIDEVNRIFEELSKLKENNYVISNSVTVPDGVCFKKPVKKILYKKPVVSASSNLKNFISAQRERKKLDGVDNDTHIAEKIPSNGHV